MLAPTSYVSPTLLCKSHHPMLVPPSNVSHNGTNWKHTQTHTQIAFYILMNGIICLNAWYSVLKYIIFALISCDLFKIDHFNR